MQITRYTWRRLQQNSTLVTGPRSTAHIAERPFERTSARRRRQNCAVLLMFLDHRTLAMTPGTRARASNDLTTTRARIDDV
jgi:hypothetical protein